MVDGTDSRLGARVEIALRQIDRLTRLAETVLDVARYSQEGLPLMPRPTDVAALVRSAAGRLRHSAESAGSTLEVHADSPAIAEVDPARVEQLVEELLTNAIRYGAGEAIAVRVSPGDGVVRVDVEDSGIGIATEDQERIFGLFERAAPEQQYGGLGIGLFLARRIVEAHGGRVRCTSVPGGGARFDVELPRVFAQTS
jgi:signal transduction histidine kinase